MTVHLPHVLVEAEEDRERSVPEVEGLALTTTDFLLPSSPRLSLLADERRGQPSSRRPCRWSSSMRCERSIFAWREAAETLPFVSDTSLPR